MPLRHRRRMDNSSSNVAPDRATDTEATAPDARGPGASGVLEPPGTEAAATALTPSERTQVIQFLYDKRLTLFNVRREHEWKIYFGAIALLAGLDASLLTGRMHISSWQTWAWSALAFAIFLACLGYEVQLQIRNAADRLAMDTLYNDLYDQAKLPRGGSARERTGALPSGSFGWSFRWQMLLLAAFALASILLPFTIASP